MNVVNPDRFEEGDAGDAAVVPVGPGVPSDVPYDHIEWATDGPPPAPKWVPVITVRPEAPLKGWFVNNFGLAVWTHWLDGRTRPCHGGSIQCAGCRAGQARRWKGYIAVQMNPLHKLALLEIPAEAGRAWPTLCSGTGAFRRQPFVATRVGKSRQSRVSLVIGGKPIASELLSAEIDQRLSLLQLWGYLRAFDEE